MTAEITVRRMTPDDLASWRWLRRDGLTRFPGAFILSSDEYEARTDEAEADFLRHGLVHGVFDGTRPLGMAALRIMPFARARHRAEVGPFYVVPEAQGTGAADLLMEALVTHARELGVTQLELSVAADNPRAVRFYERHGFLQEGRLPNAVMMPEGPQTDLFCVRLL